MFEKLWDLIKEFAMTSGIAGFFDDGGWKNLIMIAIAIVLLCLAIFKGVEPYLLIPISFGMLLANLPLGGVFVREVDGTYSGLLGVL